MNPEEHEAPETEIMNAAANLQSLRLSLHSESEPGSDLMMDIKGKTSDQWLANE